MLLRILLLALACLPSAYSGSTLPVPLYSQEKNGCGAASLAMLTGYWAQSNPALPAPSAAQLHRQLHVESEGGVRLSDMKTYLRENGFQAFTVRGTWADVEEHLAKRRPLLIALRHGKRPILHYALVTGTDGNKAWLHDPARKKPKKVSQRKLKKQWAAADNWLLIATPAGR